MIKSNQRKFNRIQMLLDAVAIVLSYVIAWYIMFGSSKSSSLLSVGGYMSALIVIVPLYLLLYDMFGYYMPKRVSGIVTEIGNIFKANTIGVLLITLVLFFGSKNQYLYHFSRMLVFIFYCHTIIIESLERFIIRYTLRNMRAVGYNQKHMILLGYSRAAESYIDRVLANPQFGYNIRGILDDDKERGFSYKGIKVIGTLGNLEGILEMNVLDEIAITLSINNYSCLESLVKSCEKSGVHTKFIPDYNHIIPTIPHIEDLDGLAVINIRYVPLTRLYNAFIKRIIDIIGALLGIAVFSPVMLVVAIIIKLTSKGPIIFSQERVGLHNRAFKMYKFRSMRVQAPQAEKVAWTTPHDPRVTGIGKFIRKTSIDETPQFFNILKGDMSLIGPRPERPYYVEKFKEEIPQYMIKHQVRPGLTGWAQVNGYRGDTSIEKRIEYDLYYIENWTIGLDLKILFLTVFKGFINKNAY